MTIFDGVADQGALWPWAQMGLFVSFLLIALATPGYLLLATGSGSRKHAIGAIYRILAGAAVATIAFASVGRDIVTGSSPLIDALRMFELATTPSTAANDRPFAIAPLIDTASALLAYVIAAAVSIGRIRLFAALLFAALFAGLVYPLALFSTTHPEGLLTPFFEGLSRGYALHLIGAGAALAGALMLGPRLGFNGYDPIDIGPERLLRIAASHAPHHTPMTAQGVLLIWLSFVGVATATHFASFGGNGAAADIAQIRAAAGLTDVLTALFLAPVGGLLALTTIQGLLSHDLEAGDLLYSVLAALAAIAPSVGSAGPIDAMTIGALGALAARVLRGLIEWLNIDDPIANISTHSGGALVGLALASLVGALDAGSADGAALERLLEGGLRATYGLAVLSGAFILCLVAYKVAELSCKLIAILSRRASLRQALTSNQLRIDFETEIFGMDETQHGQDAYSFRALR